MKLVQCDSSAPLRYMTQKGTLYCVAVSESRITMYTWHHSMLDQSGPSILGGCWLRDARLDITDPIFCSSPHTRSSRVTLEYVWNEVVRGSLYCGDAWLSRQHSYHITMQRYAATTTLQHGLLRPLGCCTAPKTGYTSLHSCPISRQSAQGESRLRPFGPMENATIYKRVGPPAYCALYFDTANACG